MTYGVGGKHYRATMSSPVTTENLSDALDAHSAGGDSWLAPSPAGDWFVLETTRLGCDGWSCLAVAKGDLSSVETIKVGGEVVHGDRYSAIASGGQRVVYPIKGGPHELDLYTINRQAQGWGTPILLTANSPYSYNAQPNISENGDKVVFDCGEDPYNQPPTSICEVHTDGTQFRVVWTPEQGATGETGRADAALHHPDYFADGSILFEGDWSGEKLWRLTGDGPPVEITDLFGNDNSPCALPNNCIVSLWLERPNSPGIHEMKVMDPSGGNFSMVVVDRDVVDTGTGCSL